MSTKYIYICVEYPLQRDATIIITMKFTQELQNIYRNHIINNKKLIYMKLIYTGWPLRDWRVWKSYNLLVFNVKVILVFVKVIFV